ncbi:lactate racemase domain-containing protein [Rubrobacter calidifluminis]|uniref:lactate racemase domain-containing protein n=1 Tax=Rubrobacter calidifluminis TaxID=1392640 RepID=UPI002361EBD4|nr:lactate racemase domain-containing protein [Rubrobacter calidifluminis]
MKRVRLEYGDSWMDVDVPENALIARPGEDFPEPEPLEDPVEATRNALSEPLGCPPIRELVGPGSKVVIAFPDRVKGGAHTTAHRRVSIPLILEELAEASVDERDIRLICAIGLHRKNTYEEFESYLGPRIATRFRGEKLVNHDPEDPREIVRLGETDRGDVVEINRAILEADLVVTLGHTLGNPYGGYSGGYKMPCTGLTSWRSIRCHHTPKTMHREDFTPASTRSHFRHQLTEIGRKIEENMKAPFFMVDAVLDGRSRQIAVFAGRAEEVEKASWPVAGRRTEVTLEKEKADVLVLGMPRSFHYGPGMGSNPILMLQAIGSSIVRNADALIPNPVVICASVCDGWFNDEWFPSYRETYELFQRCATVDEMQKYEEDLCMREEYISRFRHAYGYHPYHAFSMLYMGGIALERARAIYIAGAEEPECARGVGCIPTRTFEEALRYATRHVGKAPRMLVIPELSKPQVHVSSRA